jgi:hypothetical protein
MTVHDNAHVSALHPLTHASQPPVQHVVLSCTLITSSTVLQYKCNPKTGQCKESCPDQCGQCIADTPPLPHTHTRTHMPPNWLPAAELALLSCAQYLSAHCLSSVLQYKCNPKTGQCKESCPKPNGTPCKDGKCQCGQCNLDPHTCNLTSCCCLTRCAVCPVCSLSIYGLQYKCNP